MDAPTAPLPSHPRAQIHELFWSFMKIGLFTIGGGYAMIPLMESELVNRRRWVDHEKFLDMMSVAQGMPGIFAMNMATAVGYQQRGILGAASAIVGNILFSVLIILALAMFFSHFSGNHAVDSIFKGIRPAVVALIAAPVFSMTKSAGITWANCWVPIVAAALIWALGVSPVLIIATAGICGFIYGRVTRRRSKPKKP